MCNRCTISKNFSSRNRRPPLTFYTDNTEMIHNLGIGKLAITLKKMISKTTEERIRIVLVQVPFRKLDVPP